MSISGFGTPYNSPEFNPAAMLQEPQFKVVEGRKPQPGPEPIQKEASDESLQPETESVADATINFLTAANKKLNVAYKTEARRAIGQEATPLDAIISLREGRAWVDEQVLHPLMDATPFEYTLPDHPKIDDKGMREALSGYNPGIYKKGSLGYSRETNQELGRMKNERTVQAGVLYRYAAQAEDPQMVTTMIQDQLTMHEMMQEGYKAINEEYAKMARALFEPPSFAQLPDNEKRKFLVLRELCIVQSKTLGEVAENLISRGETSFVERLIREQSFTEDESTYPLNFDQYPKAKRELVDQETERYTRELSGLTQDLENARKKAEELEALSVEDEYAKEYRGSIDFYQLAPNLWEEKKKEITQDLQKRKDTARKRVEAAQDQITWTRSRYEATHKEQYRYERGTQNQYSIDVMAFALKNKYYELLAKATKKYIDDELKALQAYH
ncbi:hypothetical protein JW887_04120 [Candidatus Dojkabacteria bacterium]|nr:hypothetical protein [Candidatus Dojkabacteria bacterium]